MIDCVIAGIYLTEKRGVPDARRRIGLAVEATISLPVSRRPALPSPVPLIT